MASKSTNGSILCLDLAGYDRTEPKGFGTSASVRRGVLLSGLIRTGWPVATLPLPISTRFRGSGQQPLVKTRRHRYDVGPIDLPDRKATFRGGLDAG